MSQQLQVINLYLPEFRKKKEWLDAAGAAQLLALIIGVMILLTGSQLVRTASLDKELADIETQRQQVVLATQAMSETAGARAEDQNLVQRTERLEAELESKQALLQFMSGRQLGNTQGFSEYLADLSRYHTNGLSLHDIQIQNGGETVRLEGEVLRAELVPLYLQNLSQGVSYRGKDFDALDISESSGSLLGRLTDLAGMEQMAPKVWKFSVSSDAGR